MNRSLIELTRYALGTDFLVRRIDREVIESTAKDLLPLFEKVTVEEGLLERVVDELCNEQSEKLQENAIDEISSSINYVDIPELPNSNYNFLPRIESLSVDDVEVEHINDVEKIEELVDECERFKSDMTNSRYEFEGHMEEVQELIDKMDDVIDEADDIIMKLENRFTKIEMDKYTKDEQE